MKYVVELVWNREFHWRTYKVFEITDLDSKEDKLKEAIRYADTLINMGDGASVKKVRVLDSDGEVLYRR